MSDETENPPATLYNSVSSRSSIRYSACLVVSGSRCSVLSSRKIRLYSDHEAYGSFNSFCANACTACGSFDIRLISCQYVIRMPVEKPVLFAGQENSRSSQGP